MISYVFTGGTVSLTPSEFKIGADALVVAADSGYDNAKSLGFAERVDLIVGDFDSTAEHSFPSRAEILRFPPEKDKTDTQIALDEAIRRGADEIIIIGGLSGRLDHTLSNVYLLEALSREHGVRATLCDGQNRVRYLYRSALLVVGGEYKYFSLIPADEKVTGVSVKGARYPLERAVLRRSNPSLGVSNEVCGSCAMVSCARGGLFVIESRG